MKRVLSGLLLLVLLGGCGPGQYLVPKRQYQTKVQVLGVLPLLIDRSAQLDYPYSGQLFDLLARSAAQKHLKLVERLRQEKGYFDVRALAGGSELLSLSLLQGPPGYDELGRPTGISLSTAAVNQLLEQNVVDGLLVVVLTGAELEQTKRSRTMLESLKTRYSNILATAAVVGKDGQIFWEMAGADVFQLLSLQYPDFDEAYYNRSDAVAVKNISLAGVERILSEPAGRGGDGALPKVYDELFQQIVDGISPGLFDAIR